jgi:hypothetical protein
LSEGEREVPDCVGERFSDSDKPNRPRDQLALALAAVWQSAELGLPARGSTHMLYFGLRFPTGTLSSELLQPHCLVGTSVQEVGSV